MSEYMNMEDVVAMLTKRSLEGYCSRGRRRAAEGQVYEQIAGTAEGANVLWISFQSLLYRAAVPLQPCTLL